MNLKTATGVVLITASVVIPARSYLKVRRVENKKREQIRLNMEKDIAAIRRSSRLVQEMIRDHHYDGKSIADIMSDLEFYRMTSRED